MQLEVFCTMHPLDSVCHESTESLWKRCLKEAQNAKERPEIADYYNHPSGAGYLSMNIENTNYTSCWLILPPNVIAYVALEHHGSYSGNDIVAMVTRTYNGTEENTAQIRRRFCLLYFLCIGYRSGVTFFVLSVAEFEGLHDDLKII